MLLASEAKLAYSARLDSNYFEDADNNTHRLHDDIFINYVLMEFVEFWRCNKKDDCEAQVKSPGEDRLETLTLSCLWVNIWTWL